MPYRSPVRDLAFSLTAVAGIDQVAATGAFPDYDADLMAAVMEATRARSSGCDGSGTGMIGKKRS